MPSLYHKYKAFGGGNISAAGFDRSEQLGDEARELLESVVLAYQEYSAIQLSNVTHAVGTPWHRVTMAHGIGAIIPDEYIKEYYRARATS